MTTTKPTAATRPPPYGPRTTAAQRLLRQQRANERLAIATSTVPWCNSTMPRNYAAPELNAPPVRPTSAAAHQLPSRVGRFLHYPDGRTTTLDGQPHQPCQSTPKATP